MNDKSLLLQFCVMFVCIWCLYVSNECFDIDANMYYKFFDKFLHIYDDCFPDCYDS